MTNRLDAHLGQIGWSCGLVHCPGENATDLISRVLASSDGIFSWTPLKPQHINPNFSPLANQLWCVDFLTPPTPLIIPHRLPAFFESLIRPVGCRIRRLHLCRGVRPPPNEATCWPWVATRKALGRIPGGEQSLIWWQSGQWLATHHFGPYLVWRAVGLGPIRSIGWSQHALAHMWFSFFLLSRSYHTICSCGTIRSTFAELFPTLFFPYVLEGGGWRSIVLR